MTAFLALLVVLITLAILGAVGALIFNSLQRRKENKILANTPLAAIERSGDVYKIAQRSIRELERILDDDMVRVTVPETTQHRMRDLIEQFDRLP